MSLAFVFPGQGSQYVGMCRQFYDNYQVVRDIFDLADKALAFSISELCFQGPEELLGQTENTQPAVLTASIACQAVLLEAGIAPEALAGHSLGEYSALVAAGALSFSDAVQIVRKRGQLMQQAVPPGGGAMAAILGLDAGMLQEVCKHASDLGMVEVANYNCPGQLVIAGSAAALEKAIVLAKEAGAKRAIKLVVSGPFHSALMFPAAEKLGRELEQISIIEPKLRLVANISADYVTTAEQIKDCLVRQVYGPVRWIEVVQKMINDGIDTFVEVGPGKVLSGLIKKIDKRVNIYNVEDQPSLEKALASLKGVS
ncbi:malonyl CoA-acyl carrier protein transacylase [Desulfofarcimen acetoxidans DSM 771]|jgi:[acyl-carrier-protein] S-malonyltransferase|uniref:Malonyl CoA-acyl carrier protein transacylase n=1 Tax=Desulfofarcimen acetoxidans (strain ATCC 49208 / DSM 771 / KCTC 5769 / VKM B-1644 / 5575) TaxID=485916 RepID=C8W582_DESAS|nr:ACP S-malonyltransferase [Desulfofarcimen acetoxidans]ACV62064.1 malonyl CoA-acyl carrier protein transacylase [Desulfofarcimen acetoxidans DSM 771]